MSSPRASTAGPRRWNRLAERRPWRGVHDGQPARRLIAGQLLSCGGGRDSALRRHFRSTARQDRPADRSRDLGSDGSRTARRGTLQKRLAARARRRPDRRPAAAPRAPRRPDPRPPRGRRPHPAPVRDDLAARGIEVIRVERGGEVTYHGPGQLVAYPIIALARPRAPAPAARPRARGRDGRDLRGASASIAGRRDGHPGCWCDPDGPTPRKIGALGVRVERGVSYHGIALNVTTDLADFELIDPCGMPGVISTSIAARARPRRTRRARDRRRRGRAAGEAFATACSPHRSAAGRLAGPWP